MSRASAHVADAHHRAFVRDQQHDADRRRREAALADFTARREPWNADRLAALKAALRPFWRDPQ